MEALSKFFKGLLSLERVDPFIRVPDEVLLLILGHLPALTLAQLSVVNKRFYRLTSSSDLWKYLVLRIGWSCNNAHISSSSFKNIFISKYNEMQIRNSFRILDDSYRFKVILLGEPGAGKTTLCHRLIHGFHCTDYHQNSR